MVNVPTISVIIPLYNAEKYIADCLNSILAQTFQNFEVIVVNDCSTDTSPAIVESFMEKFGGRLKIRRTEKNSGVGASRSRGFDFSRGEYVFFMDNDDLITKTALEELYTLAKNFDAEVVYCEKYYLTDNDAKGIQLVNTIKDDAVDKPTFETENLVERFNRILTGKFFGVPWLQLVSRDLLIENNINYPPMRGHDDTIYTWSLIFFAKKFLRVPNATYIYRLSDDSITRKKDVIPAQKIDFNIHMTVEGVQAIRKLTDKLEFFKQNPMYLYALLDYFFQVNFKDMLKKSLELQPYEIYEIIKQKFGEKLGEQDVLVSALCTFLNNQQKIFAANNQRFNQFAEQAQNRIKDLEAQLAKSQRRIAELEARLK